MTPTTGIATAENQSRAALRGQLRAAFDSLSRHLDDLAILVTLDAARGAVEETTRQNVCAVRREVQELTVNP